MHIKKINKDLYCKEGPRSKSKTFIYVQKKIAKDDIGQDEDF